MLARARANGRTVATVESCTGGLIASLLTDHPGASDVFVGGWVPYGNTLKVATLDVPVETLEAHGAVSEPVARALAHNAQRVADVDVALATTGILGPAGATGDKPVGFVWFAIATRNGTEARSFQAHGDRLANKRTFAQEALALIDAALAALQDKP